jgi:hypothetical protein
MAKNEVKGQTDGSLTGEKLFDMGAFEFQDEFPACMVGDTCKEAWV